MNLKDLKIGETYLLPVTVTTIEKHGRIEVTTCHDYGYRLVLSEVNTLLPNTTKNTETAPKYDPFRKFRKGDIVEPSKINGRLPQELLNYYRYEVIIGEGETSNPLYVTVKPLLAGNYKHISDIHVNVAFLKLVTPVEELSPYEVECDGDDEEYSVTCRNKFVCTYPYDSDSFYTKEQAKAAAEAERKRLNEAWRKGLEI